MHAAGGPYNCLTAVLALSVCLAGRPAKRMGAAGTACSAAGWPEKEEAEESCTEACRARWIAKIRTAVGQLKTPMKQAGLGLVV